ncbi:hypothetical protein A0H81_07991 [Grifola frondosa]|uniref:DUF6534 domain-containing protein n=1 Tax=Grifola frondosa TaxID=5627 RepID=A0A1C7M5H3_GRIFR|nr:hypothetical protein A0H81_07991 [Grifola frondosa]
MTFHSLGAPTVQERPLNHLGIALNVITASTDILITASLCTLLLRSRSGSKRANILISKLPLLRTVNLQLLVLPNTNLYILFFYLSGRFYSISLVATLNARRGLRKQVDSVHMLHPKTETARVARETERSVQCFTDEIHIDMDYDSEVRRERPDTVSRLEDDWRSSTGFDHTVRHCKGSKAATSVPGWADPDV